VSALSSPSRPHELTAGSARISGAVATTARIPGPGSTGAGGIKTRPRHRDRPIVPLPLPLRHKHHRATVFGTNNTRCSLTSTLSPLGSWGRVVGLRGVTRRTSLLVFGEIGARGGLSSSPHSTSAAELPCRVDREVTAPIRGKRYTILSAFHWALC
jgi:hypothetical protein